MAWSAEPSSPTTKEMKISRPRRIRIIGRTARRTARQAPVRLVSITDAEVVFLHQREQLALVISAFALAVSLTGAASLRPAEEAVEVVKVATAIAAERIELADWCAGR